MANTPPTSRADLETIEEKENLLPPVICNNPREKIDPEQIDYNDLRQKVVDEIRSDVQLVPYPVIKPQKPFPKFPLFLSWDRKLYFELNEEPVIITLSIRNECSRPIYVHCCGLWGDTARLGASWRSHPRTRFHLAPGMASRLSVSATPRNQSPVNEAYAGLQLAAGHMRDNVVGYFVVPIEAKFLNYIAVEGE